MTTNSYKVKIKASDNVGVTQVKVPTWTLKEDANGEAQDDLVWHEATYNSSTGYWEYTVKASDHNNEIGIYRTHVYAYDAKGNRSTSYTMQFIPMGSTLNNNLGNEFLARISSKLDNNNTISVGLETTTGSSIQLKSKYTNYSDEYQIFRFIKNSDNTYTIINNKTGLYLDPKGAENNGGRQFQVTSPNGQLNQKYYLMNYNGGIRLLVASSANEFMGFDLQGAQLVENASFIPYQPRALDKANQTFSLLKVATDITPAENDISLKVNETKQLNVSFIPNDTHLKDLNYVSSDTSVVTVDTNGLITAKSKGNAIITVTTKDGSNISKQINITVTTSARLVEKDGKYYYYDENNKLVKGKFITIDNNIYFFSANDGAMKKGWFTRTEGKYYADKTTGVIATGLKTIDNAKYYFNESGIMQTGIQKINNIEYYFSNDGKMAKGVFAKVNGNLYFFSANDGAMKKSGWFTRTEGKYYSDKETGIIAVGFKDIEGKRYYFNTNGIMQKGLQTINKQKYYFDTNGVMQTGIQKINNIEYYFGTDGKMAKGVFAKVNNNLYFFSYNDSAMKKTGWFTRTEGKYYADKETGIIAVDFKDIEGKRYYFNTNGIMQKGLQTINKQKYYFDTNGVMQTGIQKINNIEYYFGTDGKMAKGVFAKVNNNLYFFSYNDGAMKKTGWFTRTEGKYYADTETGVIAVGFKDIEGKRYYFNTNGIMQKGLQTINKLKYYFDTNGEMQTGIQKINNIEYYFANDGKMAKGVFAKVNNNLYFFSYNDGAMKKTGWFTRTDGKYYADTETGVIAVGFKSIDGSRYRYYFNTNGIMQTGLKTINGKEFYFGTDGKMVRGQFVTIDNKLYFFSANDGVMKKSGWFTRTEGKYYSDLVTGEIYTGIKTIDGRKYKFSDNGVFIEEIVTRGNDYTKNYNFLYVKNTDNLTPNNKQELYDAIYTVMNLGNKSYSFTCGANYSNCINDMLGMFSSGDFWNISYFLNPLNKPSNVSYSYNTNSFTLTFTPDYSEDKITAINNKINNIETTLFANSDTIYHKLKKVHDYIVNNTVYDSNVYNNEEPIYDVYTAYGALIEGTAVCQGYAEAISIFLDRLNIPNFIVVSNTHAWNAIYINNNWYHLDVTWDDPYSTDGNNYLTYDYFVISTDELNNKDTSGNHIFDLSVYKEFA